MALTQQQQEFRRAVRYNMGLLDGHGPAGIDIPGVIAGLTAAGAQENVHLGRKDIAEGTHEATEWYAGQVLNVLRSNSLFAVNSLFNCLDRFCPEPTQ